MPTLKSKNTKLVKTKAKQARKLTWYMTRALLVNKRLTTIALLFCIVENTKRRMLKIKSIK
jgi:hypothetical protein